MTLIRNLNNVLLDAGLTPDEIGFTKSCVEQGDSFNFYDSTAFNKLFEYFTFGTAEMPYGIAKARTGDPDVWILEHLDGLNEAR
tara:strand:+ start:1910 stop:2161 length:252 start_codon:yes stop_codon:yes gene_type:complete